MDDLGLVGLIAATPENVFYVSGLESFGFAINRYLTQIYAIVARNQLDVPVVVAGLGDAASIGQLCPSTTNVVHYGSLFRFVAPDADLDSLASWVKTNVVDGSPEPDALTALIRALDLAGLSRARVGYDERGLDAAAVAEVRRRLPEVELVPAWSTFRSIRSVKTPREVESLTASLRLTEAALQSAVDSVEPGISEAELTHEFRRVVALAGGISFATDFGFGARGALGNPAVQDGKLREGDLIRFDGGCRLDGYYSDIARTFVFRGDVPPRISSLYQAVRTAEEEAIRLTAPGVPLRAVFQKAVDVARESGIPDFARHHCGHTIGLEVYDGAMVGPTDGTLVEPGMVLEVEVPYGELGLGSVQIEDTLVVGERGAEMITRISRQIEHVG
jgi:Xaa-Pro aminopeptidase